MKAFHRKGCGRAHLHCHKQVDALGFLPIGTFNCRLPEGFDLFNYKPSIDVETKKFWLVRLDGQYYGWAVRWEGSRQLRHTVEVYSKTPFPDTLKNSYFEFEVMEPWSEEEVRLWSAQIHRPFQTFPWTVHKRADSQLVWDTIKDHARWTGSSVLDIGCNHGFFSFQASKAGAHVIGFDKNAGTLETSKIINDHIESQDVQFVNKDPGDHFDTILLLSVVHQDDPDYGNLSHTLERLKSRCRNLFIELIVPPLSGSRTADQVDELVGGQKLLTYRHKVRKIRSIYKV